MANYGRGSIVKRPNGRYQAQFLHDGKRLSRTCDSRADARAWLNAQVTAAGNGELVNASRITVKQMLDRWIEVKGPAWARQGLKTQLHAVSRIKPLWSIPLSELRPDHIEEWMNRLSAHGLSGRPSSAATVNQALSALRAAIGCGIQWRMATFNPAKSVARRQGPVMRPNGAWSDLDAERFVTSIVSHKLEWAFKLGVIYGMRSGEIRALQWSDVNYDTLRLTVRDTMCDDGVTSGTTKGKRVRVLPLDPTIADGLREHRDAQERTVDDRVRRHKRTARTGLIFANNDGTALTAKALRSSFYAACDAAGVPHITFHGTRHTSATSMILMGVPLSVVRDILGHADIRTTDSLYAHVQQESKSDALRAMTLRFTGARKEECSKIAAERCAPISASG